MSVEICMPKLSDTMTEGGVVNWFVAEGDRVESGQVIAELETDKSAVDLEASASGLVARIVVPAGSEGVEVGAVLVVIDEGASAGAASSSAAAASAVSPASAGPPQASSGTSSKKSSVPSDGGAASPPSSVSTADIAASPLARRMAAQSGIDLGSVVGSGAHGKIVKADIEAALGIASEEGSVASSAAMAATPNRGAYAPSPAKREAIATRTISPRSYPDSGPTPFEDETPSRTRRVIADRLTAAKRDIPHFYLSADVDVARLVSLRAELKAKRPELGLTLNDFCVRALALALARVPDANVAWIDNKLRRWQRVDVAVAVEGPAGLITPVVAGADRLSLSDLSAAVSELARRARANDLKPHEYSGGSATISNLGMHGVSSLYPILNPPQSVIIGVGAAEDRAVVRDGVIEPGRVMTLTLAGDHRALDGATGARLLAAIRELIEDPLSLLV